MAEPWPAPRLYRRTRDRLERARQALGDRPFIVAELAAVLKVSPLEASNLLRLFRSHGVVQVLERRPGRQGWVYRLGEADAPAGHDRRGLGGTTMTRVRGAQPWDGANGAHGDDALFPALAGRGLPPVLGVNPAIRRAAALAERVAALEVPVLLLGESGTGKELFARAIHALSPRRNGPFVVLNCAAIPETLLESELFGHEKGAFTGAHQAKPGKFELAEGGTLLLDEVADLSPAAQAKLLRAVETRTVERVGGTRPLTVDVRIVAATNQDLALAVNEKRFRGDLYFRLSVFPIVLPPLRDRPEDLPLLVAHFTARWSATLGKAITGAGPEALRVLRRHPWPGNVRELQTILLRAVLLHDDGPVLTRAAVAAAFRLNGAGLA